VEQLTPAVTIRPMAPADLQEVAAMLGRLSDASLYHRFFTHGPSGVRFELDYLASVDGTQRVALVAESGGAIIGLARYHLSSAGHAETAVVVEDAWQHHGLGRRLLSALTAMARSRGVEAIDVSMLGENTDALRLFRRLAGSRPMHLDHGVFEASVPLAG
jgi:ribosomal protein S18 acetylase RimI-like enzyme